MTYIIIRYYRNVLSVTLQIIHFTYLIIDLLKKNIKIPLSFYIILDFLFLSIHLIIYISIYLSISIIYLSIYLSITYLSISYLFTAPI